MPEADGKYARFSAGVLALVAAATGIATGVFLSLNYAPTWDAAFAGVSHIQTQVGLGWLLRGIHHWAGTAAIALALVEAARMIWRGDYQRPHHRVWFIGIGLFVVLTGFGYTGYLLAGDERAYAGVLVLEGVVRSTPLIGDALASIVLGGDAVSSATLTRLYTLHVVLLPVALLALTAALVRARGTTIAADLRRQALPACGLLAALAVLAVVVPPEIGEVGGPGTEASASARPEWFFLWVNELLHRLKGKTFLVAAVLPMAIVAGACALPFLRKKPKSGGRTEVGVASAMFVVLVALSVMAAARPRPVEDEDEDEAVTPVANDGQQQDPEFEEKVSKALRRYRCIKCHVIDGDEDGGEDGPPLPRGDEFRELYTRKLFDKRIGNPLEFWPDTGMTYPKKRKPTPEEIELLARYFYGE